MNTPDRLYDMLPSPEVTAKSNLTAFMKWTGEPDLDALAAHADRDPAWLMKNVLEFCDFRFYQPYTQILDTSRGIEWARWCVGATTNIVLNCIDRHRDTPVWDQTFLVWEGENPVNRRGLTYRELDAEVCRLGNALSAMGLSRGDRIALYMPNVPETIIAYFAILKIGAVVMPLFSGFGPPPLAARLNDGEAKAVLTVDGTWRRGNAGSIKTVLDEALESVPSVEHVLVLKHLGGAIDCPMKAGRDVDWMEAVSAQPPVRDTAETAADAPAVLLYTSGTTGKPKGCVWTHVSFLASQVTRDMHICTDFKNTDRFFWMSDMGWMVGSMAACIPSYWGGSLLVAEGAPDYPDTGRFWRLIQEHRVTFLGVAPTLIRGMMRYGDDEVEKYDLSSLRIVLLGGEPGTDTAWRWFYKHVCKNRVPILNASGGTEVGGLNLTGTVHHPARPGSFGWRGLGAGVDIVDDKGLSVALGQVGELVLRNPNIGFTKSLWKDDDARYIESYWSAIPGMWVHGDFAMRDTDGLYYIQGRSDDTLKISGKRTGPSEVESLLTETGKVIEAAVVGVPDDMKGAAIVCVCVPMPGVEASRALEEELAAAVVKGMGNSFRPKKVLLVNDLPKTRNMKTMRRVVRSVLLGQEPGDLSSLVNPDAVVELSRRAGPGK